MWRVVSKADPDAIALLDRHYSRVLYGKVGTQLGPPGRLICLMSHDWAAVWVSHWPYAKYADRSFTNPRLHRLTMPALVAA